MIKYSVIGTSWITKSFIEGANLYEALSLDGVYSRSIEKGASFADATGAKKVFTDFNDLASSDTELVYVASPNVCHYEQCKALLLNGKHVICEKPITITAEEFKELCSIANEKNLVYFEAIMYMHTPLRNVLKEAVAKIGNIRSATIDFSQLSSKYQALKNGELPNIFNPEMETGALMDLGIYCIYPALYLFGEPEEIDVRVNMMSSGVDGSGVITFVYKDKLLSIPYSKTSQAGVDSDIQGDKGTISTTSISKLENIVLKYSDGTKEIISGETPKFKLMGYEAISFYKFITEKEKHLDEYNKCTDMCIKVAKVTEFIRLKAGIKFPTDK